MLGLWILLSLGQTMNLVHSSFCGDSRLSPRFVVKLMEGRCSCKLLTLLPQGQRVGLKMIWLGRLVVAMFRARVQAFR